MTSVTSTLEPCDSAGPLDRTRVSRSWQASLALTFARSGGKTAISRASHVGPLRVQRPFYPEGECAHVYLLHPPGGLVVGDTLSISLHAESEALSLITTPSAGKVYSLQGLQHTDTDTVQTQSIAIRVDEQAHLEWLPQETIVFNGANARLHTKLEAAGSASFVAWDIVCLGRPACAELFAVGNVHQDLEVWVDGVPKLIERNRINGEDALMHRPWGLNGAGSFGTMVASACPDRDLVDHLVEQLNADSATDTELWGLTQKDDLFIARYLGASAYRCRKGFVKIWQSIRPGVCGREAVEPRIWNT